MSHPLPFVELDLYHVCASLACFASRGLFAKYVGKQQAFQEIENLF
jgi:hypothetical protein